MGRRGPVAVLASALLPICSRCSWSTLYLQGVVASGASGCGWVRCVGLGVEEGSGGKMMREDDVRGEERRGEERRGEERS